MTTAAVPIDRLGDILIREGLLSREKLAHALAEHRASGMPLGYILAKQGLVPEVEITRIVARQLRVPAVDLTRYEVDPKIIKLIPADIAKRHVVLPLKREGRTLTVAMSNPTDQVLLQELRFITRYDLFPVFAGELLEVMKPPPRLKAALISRVKILSQLNIAERRIPQDGRLKLKMGARVIDFRVSTLPCLFGEKIVLRILDKGNLTLDLTTFGFEPKAEGELLHAITNPYGMVLVTGPTGSGKTTTLYSALQRINTVETNIMTAEDPVEYNLHGINQVQVRNEIGLSFAAALRAFLRQDPNVIMIGEIRDLETAGIAIKAALTGHLVLSTLHTNDAPSTVTRMIDMGVEAFNVSAAVNLVVAQRLVRRICKACKAPTTYREEELRSLLHPGTTLEAVKAIPFHKGRGCETCSGTGYRGRAGLFEVMAMSPELRRMVLRGASVAEIRDRAVEEGTLTLRMDGIKKIEKGVTTLEEVVKETSA